MPTCLFVCTDNAITSRLAEALFNASAPRGWRATSAGLAPAEAVDPRTEGVVRGLGYPVPDHVPRAVEKDLVSFMRVIVAIGLAPDALLPDWLGPRIDRRISLEDPRSLPDAQMGEWMTLLSEKMEEVLALCRERTPRPFG